jgi:hypothetical protein
LETEKWLLLPNRKRVQEMMAALERTAEYLGVKDSLLILGSVAQPVQLHCVPDSFSISESKKFGAYIFDDEVSSSNSDEPGKLHILASFGGVTELQIRRHLGNFEAAEVYSAPWGFYATVAASGMQCVYLPRCINSLGMQSKLSLAVSWLTERAQQITNLAKRRSQILGLNALPVDSPGAEKRKVQKMSASRKNSPSLLHWMTRLLILSVVEIGQDAFGEFSWPRPLLEPSCSRAIVSKLKAANAKRDNHLPNSCVFVLTFRTSERLNDDTGHN